MKPVYWHNINLSRLWQIKDIVITGVNLTNKIKQRGTVFRNREIKVEY